MNRSLTSVILGGFGNKLGENNEKAVLIDGTHVETNIDQVADLMINSKDIIITPGKMKIKLINYMFHNSFTYICID